MLGFNVLPWQGMGQPNQDKLGAWYMYFWNKDFGKKGWGAQGDYQFRNWNFLGDMEQLLLRSGLTYQPVDFPIKFTLGYAFISTGTFGSETETVTENRIYQEALMPQKVGSRLYLVHRYRFEQRWVEDQDMRTRWRYNLFINLPINQPDLKKGAIYVAFYNELFINGQRKIGPDRTVALFDRNRTYGALGYSIKTNLRVQAGMMRQTTDNWAKNQLQFSLHHSF